MPCISVEPNQVTIDSQDQRDNLINRWIVLHGNIFDDSQSLSQSLSDIRNILIEMASIEDTTSFRVNFIDQLKSYQIHKYHSLLKKYNSNRPDRSRDITITKLLLGTLDQESNDCIGSYFEQLESIVKLLEKSRIGVIVQEAQELQYENCWKRLMKAVLSTSFLLGSQIRSPLDKLVEIVYPKWSDINLPTLDSWSTMSLSYEKESSRIAELIAQYLVNYDRSLKSDDYQREFKNSFERPCKVLIDRTKYLMMDVYKLIRYMGHKKEFMSDAEVTIVNRYMMCRKIAADSNLMAAQIATIASGDQATSFRIMDMQSSQTGQDIPLITQQLPIEQEPAIDLSSSSPSIDINREPNLKGPKSSENTPTSLLPEQSHDKLPSPHTRAIVKILEPIGRGRSTLYTTLWSDSSISPETKEYLIVNWPHEWEYYRNERKLSNQRRAYAKKIGKLSSEKNPITYEPNNPILIEVVQAIGRGKKAEYICNWSDGRQTREKKEYLMSNWKGVWVEFIRRLGLQRQIKYLNKKRNKSSS